MVTDNPHTGLTSAASQQKSLLLQTGNPKQTPRKTFKRDLSIFLKEWRSQGNKLLLVGDFNEVLGSIIMFGYISVRHRLWEHVVEEPFVLRHDVHSAPSTMQ